jgi:membrane-bound lytic murein transglycosylase A
MNASLLRRALLALIVGSLAACASRPAFEPTPARPPRVEVAPLPGEPAALPGPLAPPRSHWVAVHWGELPGFADDALYEAWNAWIKSCERPAPVFAPLCSEVRQLSIATGEEQRAWLVSRLQPYRIEGAGSAATAC